MASDQMAKLAEEGRRDIKAKASQPHEVESRSETPTEAMLPVPEGAAEIDPVAAVEALEPQAHEAVALQADKATDLQADEVEALQPHVSLRPMKRAAKSAPKVEGDVKAEKRSTSLYLSKGALRALRMIAANEGVRPHRVIDDALRAHFKRRGYDFDTLNSQD